MLKPNIKDDGNDQKRLFNGSGRVTTIRVE